MLQMYVTRSAKPRVVKYLRRATPGALWQEGNSSAAGLRNVCNFDMIKL